RAIPGEALLEPAPNFGGGDLVIADGRVVPTSIEDGFARGLQASVPLIVGTNSNEFPWARADTSPMAQALTPDERAALVAAYDDEDDFQGRFISDVMFNGPARWLARAHAAAGNPTYLYSFDAWPDAMPQPHRGAWHAQERQYVFDTLKTSPWPTTARDQAVAQVTSDYWATFVRTGVPAADQQPTWPAFGAGEEQALVFHNDGVAVETVPGAARLDLIDALLGRLKTAGLR
ncbi:MAG: carboxylesterase, partial [Brevundimonas sp.]